MEHNEALSGFHPLIRAWFEQSVGAPTEIQSKAWPRIATGKNVLVTAPTGCGKTMAAFLWGINQLVTGALPRGSVRILYVSPLKALNNDVQRNLLKPLGDLQQTFAKAGESFPEIRVLTRSGDTPGEERRKMVRKPPEILITTPESLNLLISSRSGRSMLSTVVVVILDEIHAIIGSKRGTHLITAVERLVPLAGEFQRIALSATINPAERAAAFIGGFRRSGKGKDSIYEKRGVEIIRSEEKKKYEIKVSFPEQARQNLVDGSWWPSLIEAFRDIIQQHRSTLFFTSSRRTAEKVTRLLNEGEEAELAYAHHGSLSREIRLAVEQKLKNNELKAIVATSSLELGIDIGSLDKVVLVQTPKSASQTLQRIGRSGHLVGETSRGVIFPTHGRDFLDAAVMTRAVIEQDIEETRSIESPLDVLSQIILSMTSAEVWDIDELYAFLRAMYPYRNLAKRSFDLVLEMLAGRYADSKLRELKARVSLDRIDNTVQATAGASFLISTSGGTIPNRGYFDLRVSGTHAKIGELDEEFVWERSLGETFTLGTQAWRIQKITHNDVEVVPADSGAAIIPFWKAEEQDRDFHLSDEIGRFLEQANERVDDPGFKQDLISFRSFDEIAADELVGFLQAQKKLSRTDLPHRHHLLAELVEDASSRSVRKQLILHTFWGGKVNRPFALALAQAWEEREHTMLTITVTDDALLLMLPRTAGPDEVLSLLSPENVEQHLRRKLEQSGFFGARFRENAERALLLPKPGFRRRMPLWLMRIRSRELLAAVQHYGDFPMLLETWRTCLDDEFDLENLKKVLEELREGAIRVTMTVTGAASPFAGHLVWKQTNAAMYADDTPGFTSATSLKPDLIKEILFSPHLRPRVPGEVIQTLDAKLKRTAIGYAPNSAIELLDWVKERLLMPEQEWNELAAAIQRDCGSEPASWLHANIRKLAWLSWPGLTRPFLAAVENIPKVLLSFRLLIDDCAILSIDGSGKKMRPHLPLHDDRSLLEEYDLADLLSQWLSYYGPLETATISAQLGLPEARLTEALEPLIEAQSLVMDRISEGSEAQEVCDSANLEILLRMARKFRRPSFQAMPVTQLPLFLASYQGIVQRGSSLDDMQQRLEQLFGWPAPVSGWEEYLLPARMNPYRNEWLDQLLNTTDLIWFGCGRERISIAFKQDCELFQRSEKTGSVEPELSHLLPERRGRYSLLEIAERSRLDTVHATDLLWKEAWKGHVTSDSFGTLRKGVLTRFTAASLANNAEALSRRSGLNRWKSSRPLEGHWLRIDPLLHDRDVLEEEELVKDRVRQLLKRYGILFRELLLNEPASLQWKAIFRSLRFMELSGEILSGYFFEGMPGPQFISPEAFRMLQDPLPVDSVFWMNATDPASLCGLGLHALPGLPSRLPSTTLVYQGSDPVMILKRQGREIEIAVPETSPRLADIFAVFKDMLSRGFNAPQKITIEKINGQPALSSPYVDALKRFGFQSARTALEMWKTV